MPRFPRSEVTTMSKQPNVNVVKKEGQEVPTKEMSRSRRKYAPSVDILETQEALVVRVELPGVRAEDLHLSVLGGAVIIKGDKKRASPAQSPVKFHEAERAFGGFRRVINLVKTSL